MFSLEHYPYNELPDDNELVKHYRPRFLARGGDHLVYEVVEHPDVIIKASTFTIKDILSDNSENGRPLDSLSGELKIEIEGKIAKKNTQIRQLREYFGNEHTLAEKRYIMKVPITRKLLDEIFVGDWKNRLPPDGSEDIREVWSTVVVQERTDVVNDPNHVGLYFGGFLEEREYDLDEYRKLNQSLLRQNVQSAEDIERFLDLQDNPQSHALRDIMDRAQQDRAFKEVVGELLVRIISYTRETGNILALAGKDNIVLYQKDGVWNYLLVDALPIHDEPVFREAQKIVHKFVNGGIPTKHEKLLLMKALNFTRTINGLSAGLGIDNRLDLILREDIEKDIDFTLATR